MIVRCPSCDTANRIPARRMHERATCGSCKTPLSPIAHPLAIHADADFDELVGSASVPVLVDFWAPWCGPCRAVAPQLEVLARRRAGHMLVAKVDTDALPAIAQRFGIRSIPTMVLFSEGREARRISGAMPADAIAHSLQL